MQGVGVKPSLALEALNTPDHSPLELLLASQIPHTHGLHPTSESLSVSFWTLLYAILVALGLGPSFSPPCPNLIQAHGFKYHLLADDLITLQFVFPVPDPHIKRQT